MKNIDTTMRYVAVGFGVWIAIVAAIEIHVAGQDMHLADPVLRHAAWWQYGQIAHQAAMRLGGGIRDAGAFAADAKALLFFAIFMLAAYGYGTLPARRMLDTQSHWTAEVVPAVLLGMTFMGLLMFALGTVHLWFTATAVTVLGVGFVLGVLFAWQRWRKGMGQLGAASDLSVADIFTLCINAFVVALVVLYALSPPVQSDALRYHLAATDQWRQAGRITYLPGFAHSNLPFLVEMNFALALLLGLPAGAQLVHVTYYLVAAGFAGLLAQRMAAGETSGGLKPWITAVALLLTHPVAAPLAAWPYVDLATLAYLLGMIWALAKWMDEDQPRTLLLFAAIFAGGAFATKYTNLLPLALSAAIVLGGTYWKRRLSIIPAICNSILFATIAAIICAPWLIRNTINTGNPVYPLAYSIFGGLDWSSENAAFYASKAAEKGTGPLIMQQQWREARKHDQPGPTLEQWDDASFEYPREKLLRYAKTPWTTYRWPGAFEDFAQGPLFLLMLPIALLLGTVALLRRRIKATQALCAAFALFLFATWCITYESNRFLLPVPILLSLFLAAWAGSSRALRIPARIAAGFLLIAQSSWVAQYILADEPYAALRPVLGRESTDDYLRQSINYYDAANWLNRHAGWKGALLAGEHRTYYFHVPVYAADWFDTPAPLRLIRQTRNTDEALDYLKKQGYGYVLLNAQELLGGLPQAQQMILESRNPDLLKRVLNMGYQALNSNAPRLGAGASNYDYFRRRFNDTEWQRWIDLIGSARLKEVYASNPLVKVYYITGGAERE